MPNRIIGTYGPTFGACDRGTGYNQGVWYAWNHNITTSASTYVWPSTVTQVTNGGEFYNSQVWQGWQVNGPAYSHEYQLAVDPPTAEELQERAVVRARGNLIHRNRMRSNMLRRKRTERRAEEILLDNLTDEQADEYRRLERFAVVVGDRTYRIRKGMHGNIDVIEDDQVIERLCVYAQGNVPPQDNMLAQKLILETDEEYLRRTANITPMRRAA